MARAFNGSSDLMTTSTGGLAPVSAGPITIAFVVKLAGTSRGSTLYSTDASSNAVWQTEMFNGTWYFLNGTDFASTTTASTGDNWHLMVMTKVAGAATPNWRKYVYDTNTWTSGAGSGTVQDVFGSPGVGGSIQMGRWGGGDYLNGSMAIQAVWTRVLSQEECEMLPHSVHAWKQLNPIVGWIYDQSATTQALVDWVADANQSSLTGTTVSTDSAPMGYGIGPSIGQLPAGFPAPITGSGSLSSGTFDLTGDRISVRLDSAGVQETGLETYPVDLRIDVNNRVFIVVSGGFIGAYQVVSGVSTGLAFSAYNPVSNLWFQIREAGGTTFWETGANGTAWTTIHSAANPIAVNHLTYQAAVNVFAPIGTAKTVSIGYVGGI